ncbi:DEAD/DEAH box helicase [Clostridium perfringens]
MSKFPLYTTDYISGAMSLRKPQEKSLKILENILRNIKPTKNMDLTYALKEVKKIYPIFSDFERDFMSLSFVLATGVGKTRLMGAFIAYLYTQHNIKNFFIVAPGNTVYTKLKQDFGNPANPKYVFKGLGCFNDPPQIITDDDFRTKSISLFESDIKIYIYNIGKFDKDNVRMKSVNEVLGDSFYQYLSKLDDLVLIMDEAHHYHGKKGSKSLNELNPILGLELTATPYYNIGSKQALFRNAVYEYPLSSSIKDGYTRTPFALTQRDVDFYNFGEEDLDKIMIQDGIKNHENIKKELELYSNNSQNRKVKPFMMVVCKDTEHATRVYEFIVSDRFKEGKYANKTLLIHSNQSKVKREENTKLLLEVEKAENLIEIVIHVDMLKEGWDVNNLYTIVPLRTASSKILREQMVGRGLRLPFGERTGFKHIDAVMLTAHGKFEEIIKEAQKGDSIFNAKNIIYAEEIEEQEQEVTQIALEFENEDKQIKRAYEKTKLEKSEKIDKFFEKTSTIIANKISEDIKELKTRKDLPNSKSIGSAVVENIENDKDLKEIFEENEMPLVAWIKYSVDNYVTKTIDKFIPIPLLKITDDGVEEYKFLDFDLDFTNLNYVPYKHEIILQNLETLSDKEVIEGDYINFDAYNPKKEILSELRIKSEIDYEKCSELLYKLITQFTNYYSDKFGEDGMKNIVMMNKKSIASNIHKQMFSEEHFYFSRGLIKEEIIDMTRNNKSICYNYKYKKTLFEEYEGNIGSNLFTDIKKGVFDSAKFDSYPELVFARILETDKDVLNWLRPHPQEFNLYYNRGKRYEPDFVVETVDIIYLVEVKGEDKLDNADVIAKKERAAQYCKIATEWGKVNGYKRWVHLFIPSQQITQSSSFINLAARFKVE